MFSDIEAVREVSSRILLTLIEWLLMKQGWSYLILVVGYGQKLIQRWSLVSKLVLLGT